MIKIKKGETHWILKNEGAGQGRTRNQLDRGRRRRKWKQEEDDESVALLIFHVSLSLVINFLTGTTTTTHKHIENYAAIRPTSINFFFRLLTLCPSSLLTFRNSLRPLVFFSFLLLRSFLLASGGQCKIMKKKITTREKKEKEREREECHNTRRISWWGEDKFNEKE